MREFDRIQCFLIGLGITSVLTMILGFIGMVAGGIITGYLSRKGTDSIFIGYFVGFGASIVSVVIRFLINPSFLAEMLSQGDAASLTVAVMGVGFIGGIIIAFVAYFGALFYKYNNSGVPIQKS